MQRTICSIYPLELRERRPYRPRSSNRSSNPGGFNTTFIMEPATRTGHSLLTIEDMEETFKFMSDAPPSVTAVYADGKGGVADDLVNAWTGHTVGEAFGGPGIFICTELDVKNDAGEVITPATKPGPKELEVANKRQTSWLNWIVMEADGLWINGRRGEIKDQHRMAAEWLGYTNREWYKPAQQEIISNCPLCQAAVSNNPMICPNCKHIIDQERFYNWERLQEESRERLKQLHATREESLKANPELAELEQIASASGTPSVIPPALVHAGAVKPVLPGRK